MKSVKSLIHAAVIASTFCNVASRLDGATYTWNTGSANWNTTDANWTGVGTQWVNANDAVFGGTPNSTVTINTSGVSATSLNFNVTGDTIARTSTNTLTLTGAASVTVGSGLSNTISAPIAGSTGLSKLGTGTLVLSGANSYSGGTSVNAGTLKLDLTSRSNNAQLNLGTFNVAADATLELSTDAAVNYGTTALTTGGTVFTGTGTITKTGTGIVDWWGTSAANTTSIKDFAGLIDIQAGTLANQTVSDWSNSAGNMSVNIASGAYFDLRTANAVINNLTGAGTIGSSFTAGMILTVGAQNGSSTFGGVIQNTVPAFSNAPTVGLTKTGTGTLTLTGTNTYTGNTIVNGGQLLLSGNTAAINSASFFLRTGGELKLTGTGGNSLSRDVVNSSPAVFADSGNAALSLDTGVTETIDNIQVSGGGVLTVNVASGSTLTSRLFPGITTAGTLVLNGPGSVSSNTGLGSIRINNGGAGGGTLTLQNGVTLIVANFIQAGGGTSVINFDNATVKALSSQTGFMQSLTTANVKAGGVTFDSNGFNITIAQALLDGGGGGVTKTGAGTLTLSSAGNTFIGNVTVDGGTLKGTAANAFGSASNTRTITVNNGGTLDFGVANVYGGANSITVPTLVVNAGGTVTNSGTNNNNALYDLILNGGTLTATASNGTNWLSWDINGSITSTGTSLISPGSAPNPGIRLKSTGGATTVDVQSGTLTLSAPVGDGRSGTSPFSLVQTGLNKTGAGTLLLSGLNTYTGGTTINDGSVSFANGSLGTTGPITMNGGTLRWESGNTQDVSSRFTMVNGKAATVDTNGNNVTFASSFGGSTSGALEKVGAGTLTLSGNNSYTGATSITAGTLALAHSSNNNIAASEAIIVNSTLNVTALGSGVNAGRLDVQSAQTLAGNGSLVGTTSLLDGATVSPGNSVGTLFTDDFNWQGGGTYDWEIESLTGTPGVDWDLLDLMGNTLTLMGGGPFNVAIDASAISDAPLGAFTFEIARASSIVGFDASDFALAVNGPDDTEWSIFQQGSSLYLQAMPVAAVPEPSTLVLFAMCALACVARERITTRRRRTQQLH